MQKRRDIMPVTKKTYPEWVQKFRTRGTTVKKKGDAYYLYKRTSKRVPGKQYPQPVDVYIGLITPEGIVKSGKRKIDISTAEVREFGFSKALKELCPQAWKETLGDEWEDVFLHVVQKLSPRSYLLRGRKPRDEKELHCSMSAQYGLFSRRMYNEHGVNTDELRILEDIYIIYMDGHEVISRISDEQKALASRLGLRLEVD